MINKLQQYLRRHRASEFCLVVVLYTVLVLGIVIGCGTLGSGWHLVDDHEILEWTNPIRSGEVSVWEEAQELFPTDYHARFRPLYYPIRLLTILVLGNNMVAYSVLKAFQTILAFVLLYYMGKSCGGSMAASFLFSLLSLTGYQAAVWWKLGPQELQGTIYLAIGMLTLNAYLRSGRRWIAVISWICFLIMCNWKESFIVLMPFVILYVVYAGMRDSEGTLVQRVLAGIKAHPIYIGASAVLFAVIVLIIVCVVGTNNSSGAGISTEIGIGTILSSYEWAFTHDLKYYYGVTLLLTGILLTYWEEIKGMRCEILLFAAFMVPNLILYGKEAMAERYIIPSSIGWGLFYVVAVMRRRFLSGKRRTVYVAGLVVLFTLGLRSTIIEADYYRFRGESVTSVMEYVAEVGDEARIMSCLGYSNPEAERTIDAWMIYYGVYQDLYYWDEMTQSIYASNTTDDEVLTPYPLEDMDVVVAYNGSDRHYTGRCMPIREGWLDEDYTLVTVGSLDVYVRNDSGLPFPVNNIEMPIYY